MQAGMHEIAVNVIVHYKASASVVFLCRKARGCCMHVFSSTILYYTPMYYEVNLNNGTTYR